MRVAVLSVWTTDKAALAYFAAGVAVFTAAMSVRTTRRLASLNVVHRLHATMRIVETELHELAVRIRELATIQPAEKKKEKYEEYLTFHDWLSLKPDIAPLADYDHDLFHSLAITYGAISDCRAGIAEQPREDEFVDTLADRLGAARTALKVPWWEVEIRYRGRRRPRD